MEPHLAISSLCLAHTQKLPAPAQLLFQLLPYFFLVRAFAFCCISRAGSLCDMIEIQCLLTEATRFFKEAYCVIVPTALVQLTGKMMIHSRYTACVVGNQSE